MLVRSATALIGKTPARSAEATPAIQVTRCGVPCRSVLANQPGSSPSRLIENQTRVTPRRKVSITVRMDRTAKTEMIVAITGSPTPLKAEAKPALGSMSCVVLHAGQHQRGGDIEQHGDDQREDDRLRHVLLAVGGLLRRRTHGVVAKHREEHRCGAGQHGTEAAGQKRVVVVGVDVEDAQADDEQDQDDLDATAISSKRPKVLVPRERIQVTSRQTRIAGRLTMPPVPSSGVEVIQTGIWMPMPERKASK